MYQAQGLFGMTSLSSLQKRIKAAQVAKVIAAKPMMFTAMRATMYKPNHAKACTDTGMPAEMVTECVKLLKLGVPMSKVMPALQSQHAAAQAAAEAASASSAAAPVGPAVKPDNTKKMLIIGGVAVGGALALFLILRKKR